MDIKRATRKERSSAARLAAAGFAAILALACLSGRGIARAGDTASSSPIIFHQVIVGTSATASDEVTLLPPTSYFSRAAETFHVIVSGVREWFGAVSRWVADLKRFARGVPIQSGQPQASAGLRK